MVARVQDLDQQTEPGGHKVVTVTGELDRTDIPSLRATLLQAFELSPRAVILDLTDLVYLDSSVLGTLIGEALEATGRGARLAIVTGPAGIMRSLELKGLTEVLHLAETVEGAVAELS